MYQSDSVFVSQIGKALPHIAGHNDDIRNAGIPQLTYLPLDEYLAAYGDKPFRKLIGERRKSA